MSTTKKVVGKNKYASIILKSKDAKEQAQAEEKIEDARIQLDADIHAAKKDVNQAERAVNATIGADDFNSSDIVEAQQELAVKKANYEALVEFKNEYFS